MYEIRYEEFVGATEQYALSATDALEAIREIDANGGCVRGVNAANQAIDIGEIERRAEAERKAVVRN